MLTLGTKRPRNVDAPRAAAILYGDWGTSKAYVIGLAFAVAGYSSFWLLAAMGVLTALVAINYISVCKHYPEGGGVYASVRHRSEIISVVGAFLLIADYIVTAAISALSAFIYFGVPHPETLAAASILIIGALNYFGPKHTGGLAFLVTIPTVAVVVLIGLFSIPHLGTAISNLQPLQGGFWQSWHGFVGIVLALSGVEAVANSTGVMKLDPNSSDAKPSVAQTSTRAILWVMLEVCIFTVFLGLAMHALQGLQVRGNDVDAPGHPGVRDYMLRYMGEVFVSDAFNSPFIGHAFGVIVSIVFGALLLSAVNTAIGALISVQFLMSRDGEVPRGLQRLNSFGVPIIPIISATVIPAALVLMIKDMASLADLYAVGVVGAIAVNLGSCSTDSKLDLKIWERWLMGFTFIIMMFIEISLLYDKPHARVFAVTILAVGLVLRGLVQERQKKQPVAAPIQSPQTALLPELSLPSKPIDFSGPAILCAVRGISKTLDFALKEAKETNRHVYLLFIREQKIITEQDYSRKWQEDEEARKIFDYAKQHTEKGFFSPCYAVSDSPADTIVDIAVTLGASRLILGARRGNALINMLRGNIILDVAKALPEDIDLLVHS